MSLSQDQVLALMAFADSELEGEERRAIEALLATSDEARCVVAAMSGSALGEWLARSQDERAVAAGADSIADAVMAKIIDDEKSQPDLGAGRSVANVSSLDAAREKRAKRMQLGGVVVAIAALAAGVFFYVGSQPGGPTTHEPSGPLASMSPNESVTVAPRPAPLPNIEPEAVAGNGEVQVNKIVSSSHDVSVYEVPAAAAAANANNAASVIIWIADDSPQPKGK